MRITIVSGLWLAILLALVTVSARDGKAEGRLYAEGEVLIRWAPATGVPHEVAAAREMLQVQWQAQLVGRIRQLGIERWRVPQGKVFEVVRELQALPGVQWVEPNYLVRLASLPAWPVGMRMTFAPFRRLSRPQGLTPNDPYYQNYARRYLAPLGVEAGWELETGTPDVVVAVIDTGIDCAHEDLQGACWQNPDEVVNGIDDDGNGYVDDVNGWNFYEESPDVRDVFYHGTHVAGIIAARMNNGRGIAGIAPGVRVMPLGIFSPRGVGTYYDLIRALLYAADEGAAVINLSLGATSYSYGEALAVAYAYARGAVLVAAAGNRASDRVFYPAAHPQVIGVAATRVNGQRPGFTNWGSYVDVVAPGVSIISTIPDDRYGVLSGTSMAAPHVSGLAALIRSRNPRLSPEEVRRLIESTAEDQIGPPQQDVPGWDPYYGYGRIHVERALNATATASGPLSVGPPVFPQLPWAPPCQEILVNGDFEQGLQRWNASGVTLTSTTVYSGTQAVQLSAEQGGIISQTVVFPEQWLRATVFLAVRIETTDSGEGSDPEVPFDDWLEVELRDDQASLLLLRAGNTSDSVIYGLEWDEVLVILPAETLTSLRGQTGEIRVRVGGDGDGLDTLFTVDTVRLCVITGRTQAYFPWLMTR